jgi:hypothetical protein
MSASAPAPRTAVDTSWSTCTAETDRSGWGAKCARFFDYWLKIAPPGRLPGRQHFDPLDIPDLVSRVWMLDVVATPGGPRFRYRLVGTREVQTLEREVTGQWFDEVHTGAGRPLVERRLRYMVDNRVATYRNGQVRLMHHKDHRTVENCMVPLAGDGRTVDIIAAFSVLFWKDGSEA